MNKNFLSRLGRLESLNSGPLDLKKMSDEQLETRLEVLARKMGYEGEMEDFPAHIQAIRVELHNELQQGKEITFQ